MGTSNQTETSTETNSTEELSDSVEVDEYTQVLTAETLQTTVGYVAALVDECRLHFNQNGLNVRAVDPANVGMVDNTLSPDGFEVYNNFDDVLGVDLTRLNNIVSMADSDDLVVMRLDPQTRKLHVTFNGLEYTLALIEPDSIRDEPDIPDTNVPGEVTVEQSEISRGLTAADMVSDHITLSINEEEETFNIEAQGDTDDVDVTLDDDHYVELSPADVESLFSLSYLQDMMQPLGKNTLLNMELGDDFPVTIQFNYAEGEGSVTYVLAPRIRNS